MHQQVRMSIRTTQSDAFRGMAEVESLVNILTLLSGKNLRSAARTRSDDRGEEFVFSVQHVDGDDTADEEACDILRGEGYEAEVFKVRDYIVSHREGSLLERIKELEAELNEPVIEVYVGAAERNNKIPVQLVTRSMLNR
jgi:hypothetical protein